MSAVVCGQVGLAEIWILVEQPAILQPHGENPPQVIVGSDSVQKRETCLLLYGERRQQPIDVGAARGESELSSSAQKKWRKAVGVDWAEDVCAAKFGDRSQHAKIIRRNREELRVISMADVGFESVFTVEMEAHGPELQDRVRRLKRERAGGCTGALAEYPGAADAEIEPRGILSEYM